MRCGVLGVVTVTRDDGCPVQVTSEKQRSLLAILLSRHQQSLSADRLVELMWPHDPPASARPNVQVYVHRLRRLLGADAIVHDDAGYRLTVEPADIDAVRFEDLARTGEEFLAEGADESAREAFDEALSLWRGTPYSGLSITDAVQVEVDRLVELHLGVLGGRYEALIRLGRSAQVVSDLRAAIADHPWHERFRGQLMRALYAVGRGPDALAAYHEARRRIIDELGIDPGAELRRIEHAILTDDVEALRIGSDGHPMPTPGATTSHRVAPLPGQSPSPQVTRPPDGDHGADATTDDPHSVPADRPPDSAADPTLDSSATATDGPPAVPRLVLTPAELPAPDPAFSGRAGLVDQIAELTTSGPGRIVVLHGRGGTGKSTLALRVAQQVADAFPDGHVYVGMHGATSGREPLTAHAAVTRCLRSLGFVDREIPDDLDEAAAQLRSALAGRRLLLVLDDVRDAAQIRPMLPGAAGRSAVIVTARAAMATIGTDHVAIGVLDNADAIELLARVVGSDRVAGEPEAAADIIDLCDRLPLAVRIAAARLVARTDWSLSTMAARLADERHRLDELESDDLTVRSSCAISVDALDADAAGLFQYLGVLDLATISPHVAAALVGCSVPTAERLLDELVDVHLADPSGGPRRVLHDLVRLYARDLAEERLGDEERRLALSRVGHHYVLAARAACQVTGVVARRRMEVGVAQGDLSGVAPTLSGPAAVRQWVRHESVNVSAVTWHLTSIGGDGVPLLVALASAIIEPFGALGLWSDAATVNAVALAAAQQADDIEGMAAIHDNLGHIEVHLGRFDAAQDHLDAALRLARKSDDRPGELSALIGLGHAAAHAGRTADARRHHTEALDLARELGDTWSESLARHGLGVVLTEEGRYDDAADMFEQSLAGDDPDDTSRWRSMVLFNLGRALRGAGRMLDAIGAFEQSADLSRERGHAVPLARALWLLADVMRDVDDGTEADARRKEALDVLRELDLISDPDAADIIAQPRPTPPRVLAVT